MVCGAVLMPLLAFASEHARLVESTYVGSHPRTYGDLLSWMPAEVPNNSDEVNYNVTIDNKFVLVDIDATISNLILRGDQNGLRIDNRTFTVTGTTLQLTPRYVVVASGNAAATFDAGELSTFSGGTLTGTYELWANGFPATLRFRGARIAELREARLTMRGALSRVVDEIGSDALAQLALIDAASILSLEGRPLLTTATFTNDGALFLDNGTVFTAAGGLTNFDAATRTLTGGEFSVGGVFETDLNELRFPGADIVNNASSISLGGPGSRIADLAGLDGLRNFALNAAGATFAMTGGEFVTTGDFTNDGSLKLDRATFTVAGDLTNFVAETRTLRGGAYDTRFGTFRFRGADVVHNGATIVFRPGGMVDESSNDAFRNLTEVLASGAFHIGVDVQFTAPGDFRNAGRVETEEVQGFILIEPQPGRFRVAPGHTFTQTAGSLVNNGRFTAELLELAGGVARGRGSVTGNVTVGAATIYSDFANGITGNLTLSGESTLRHVAQMPYGYQSPRRISGDAVLAGTLEIEIEGELLLASSEILTVLQSSRPLSGVFANAPHGTRLTTVDGTGSFVVLYTADSVTLTGFQVLPPPVQLLNISGRGYIRPVDATFPSERVIIGGFIITGSQPKTVVVRGLGPSMGAAGVSSTLPDPMIRLHRSGGVLVASNDDWRDTQMAEIQASGLAPTNDREAAIHWTLEPGAYTVVLADKTASAGNGLVEVFDLSPSQESKLANVSTLAYVNDENVLIGGIIAAGEGQANADIVVRALGPQLRRNRGVFNAISDPSLELRGGNGELLASANDRGDYNDPQRRVPSELMTFFEEEPVLRVSLPRGQYTVVVRGQRGARGVALVEVFDLRR